MPLDYPPFSPSLEVRRHQSLLREALTACSPCPGFKSYRGVVICGGGIRYFQSAWVNIRMLRHLGCTLPIQLWYLGSHELNEEMENALKAFKVDCVNAEKWRQEFPVRRLFGWELKAYAIIHSSFQQVLFLDADNVCVRNPEYLFDHPEFIEHGAVFWADLEHLAPDRAIWQICEVEYRDEPEVESGQLLVDKSRCWLAMQLALHMNEYSDFYYQHIYGDKETFHMAFRRAEKSYAMPPRQPHSVRKTEVHFDFEGHRLFQHRNCAKWWIGENEEIEDFHYETECMRFLEELSEVWSCSLNDISFFNERRATPEERKLAELLKSIEWDYIRVSYDLRAMTFGQGIIKRGAAACERLWDIRTDDEGPLLTLYSDSRATCDLRYHHDGIWRGAWIVHEKMPVELMPR